MSDSETAHDGARENRSDDSDELRTIGFRMREIQRMLAARVEQENRRLEADGLEPVEDPRFVSHEERRD